MPRSTGTVLVSSALLSVLSLGASACSSDSGSVDKPPVGVPASSAPVSSAPVAKTLSAAELKGALLTAKDLPTGYTARAPESVGDLRGQIVTVTPAVCWPIPEAIFGGRGKSAIFQNYSQTANPAVVLNLYLAAYESGDAEKAMDDLKAAIAACPNFTITGKDGSVGKTGVKSLTSAPLGDDAVMFEFTPAGGEVYRIVPIRVGATLATFVTLDGTNVDQGVEFPQPLLALQLEKLKTAATG
ncbi:hypothetical protein OG900_06610 [Streptomyces sp. NBC_00433]